MSPELDVNKNRSQYVANNSAQQYIGGGQARQYIAHGDITINNSSEVDIEFVRALQGILQMQTCRGHTPQPMMCLCRGVHHSDIRIGRIIDLMRSVSGLTMPESSHGTGWGRRQLRGATINIEPFWNRPKFQQWWSAPESSMIFVRGSRESQPRIKEFCMDLMGLVRDAKIPTLWALKTASNRDSGPSSCEDIVKTLTIQALKLGSEGEHSNSLQATDTLQHLYRIFQSASDLEDWVDILALAITCCGYPRVVLLIDVHLLQITLGDRNLLHLELMSALQRLMRVTSRKGTGTVLKVVFASYGGAMFDHDSSEPYRRFLIPVKTAASHRGFSGRSATLSRRAMRS